MKITLVTGAGRGIGRAIAIAFARQGHRVAVSARSEAQLKSAAEEIAAAGGHPLVVPADLTAPGEPARIVEIVRQAWGEIEVLVNNAGVGSSQSPRPVVEFDDAFWDLSMNLNVKVPYLLTRLVLPAMLEKRWGRIINIASINAKVPSFHGAAYTASKHAIVGLTKATAMEVAADGITVNAICPGVTRSEMNDQRLAYDAERLGVSIADLEAQASPLGRRLEPEEIATLAVYLAEDGARAVNGQSINVCGGRCME